MTLIRAFLTSLSPRLTESGPLPPDDRVAMGATLVPNDLYLSEAPKLLRFFNRRVDPQEAQDLMQESFVRLAAVDAEPDRIIEQP